MEKLKTGDTGKRLTKLREKLKERDLDAALISKRENYLYLSGFNGSSAQLVITKDEAELITDFRYTEQASRQAPLYKIIQYQGSLIVALNEVIRKHGIQTLGFEEAFLTCDKYNEYREKLDIKNLIPLEGIVEHLRVCKDNTEIENIEKAVKIADEAFNHILRHIRPGVRELEIAAEIEYFMKKKGASGPAFETIVASGERSALPHGTASEKAIQAGDAVVLDFGAIFNNYCSDITRTVFVGKPDSALKEVYGIVSEAQSIALGYAGKGLTGKEIDSAARDVIAKMGYEKNFGHGLGHGVGLEIHEEPRFSTTSGTIIENGMVVTVEPGIYINGLGGVRIEDIIVVLNGKAVVLTQASKEMIVLE